LCFVERDPFFPPFPFWCATTVNPYLANVPFQIRRCLIGFSFPREDLLPALPAVFLFLWMEDFELLGIFCDSRAVLFSLRCSVGTRPLRPFFPRVFFCSIATAFFFPPHKSVKALAGRGPPVVLPQMTQPFSLFV